MLSGTPEKHAMAGAVSWNKQTIATLQVSGSQFII
jgi:hypothetical protein